MKLLFLVLLAVNLALFAYQRGAFGTLPESGREPERVARQIEPDRIRALTPDQAQALRDKARAAPAQPTAAADGTLDLSAGAACVEYGDFSEAQLAKVRPKMEALALGERLQAREVELPGWYMVYVPPFKTRAEADRAAAQLREQGVRDFIVVGDNSPLRFGIALGSFRDQELANRHLADLQRRGVKSARVADKPSPVPGTRFVIRGVDAATGAALVALQKELGSGRLAACAAAS